MKQLAIALGIVLVGALVESALLYYQASTGRRLPFRFNLSPKMDGGLQ